LIDFNDEGKQLPLKETQKIIAGSNERLYKWLHTYAGLAIQSIVPLELEQIKYKLDDRFPANLTSRDLFVKIMSR
jgi:hypothetical protein